MRSERLVVMRTAWELRHGRPCKRLTARFGETVMWKKAVAPRGVEDRLLKGCWLGLALRSENSFVSDENGESIKVHYNLLGRFEQRVNGLWQEPELALPFAYQTPKVEPTGSSPSQNGTIEVELTTWRLFGSLADSVRFGWTLWDRDLNPSNEASTGPIAVPD